MALLLTYLVCLRVIAPIPTESNSETPSNAPIPTESNSETASNETRLDIRATSIHRKFSWLKK